MKITLFTTTVLASLLMAGSAFAMDSEMIEKKMEEINQEAAQTASSKSRVEALEEQVQQLEELIQMMIEEEDGASS